MLGTVIDPTAPYPMSEEQEFIPANGIVERMEDLDCGFLQYVRGRPTVEGGGFYCGRPEPKALLWGLLLAPVMVPVGIVDGIISGRPAKRWFNPQPNDKSLTDKLGFAGIPLMAGAGLLSIYLWYRIYKAVKGGN